MSKQEFHLEITGRSVCVQLSAAPAKTRVHALIFFAAITVLGMCGMLFLPGRNGGPNMWHGLSAGRIGSGEFLVFLVLLLCFPAFMFLVLRRYLICAWPSDEKFSCDPSTLNIAKIPWLDFQNARWETRSFPLSEVRDIRFRRIANAQQISIYGLRFRAGGKKWRVLPGLKPQDAEKVLTTLKSYGADVPDDPVLARKLREAAASE